MRSQVSDCTTLTYWDGHGACERIRLMLAICGEPWEDRVALDDSGATHMTTYAQLQKLSEAGVLMADQLPLLQIDGLNLVQGWAAVRYLARKHGLYGKDNAEATKCDILQETMQDYNGKADQDDKYLCRLGRALGDGPFFLGANMSFVDVTFFRLIDNREAGGGGRGHRRVHAGLGARQLTLTTWRPPLRCVPSATLAAPGSRRGHSVWAGCTSTCRRPLAAALLVSVRASGPWLPRRAQQPRQRSHG